MDLLLAQGGFMGDLAALIGAIGGFVVGLFGIWKYFDERHKRRDAEDQQLLAQKREQEAEAGKHELEEALNRLQTSMEQLLQPLPTNEGEMDQSTLVNSVQQLTNIVAQLRKEVSDLKNRLTVLEQSAAPIKPGNGGVTPPVPLRPMDEMERRLRQDANVKRLAGNAAWKAAAEAAIAFLIRGEECPIAGWRTSSTWQQVQAAYERLQQEA